MKGTMPLLHLKPKQNRKAPHAPKAVCSQSPGGDTRVGLRSPVPVLSTETVQKSEVLVWTDQCGLAR